MDRVPSPDMATVAYRTCPLCEATCGLELRLEEGAITRVRGDRDDVFSHGFLCPKGSAIGKIDTDPDRLRQPLIRDGEQWCEASWADAFALIERRLAPILETHGRDAVAMYIGNPNAHNLAGLIYNRALIQALGSRNVYSASTVDQMPKQVSGRADVRRRRCRCPFPTSTAPTISSCSAPTRSRRTAASSPPPTSPGGCGRSGPAAASSSCRSPPHQDRRGSRRAPLHPPRHRRRCSSPRSPTRSSRRGSPTPADSATTSTGSTSLEAARRRLHARSASRPGCGIDADTIRRVARELAAAPRAAVYARIGTCANEFGTLASWLVDVCNILTGNLDREGGAMFARPAAGGANTGGEPGVGRGVRFGRRASRVRGLPEVLRRAAGRVSRRGDRDARRRAGARRSSPSPATRSCRRRTAPRLDRALGRPRLHGQRRHLPQRDHPPRRRDPARPAAARPGPLRPRALLPRACATSRTTRRRSCPLEPDDIAEWEIAAAPREHRGRAGADADPHALDDAIVGRHGRQGGPPSRSRTSPAATRRSSLDQLAGPARPGAASST